MQLCTLYANYKEASYSIRNACKCIDKWQMFTELINGYGMVNVDFPFCAILSESTGISDSMPFVYKIV